MVAKLQMVDQKADVTDTTIVYSPWVILKYAGTMASMVPILLVVGGAKAEL